MKRGRYLKRSGPYFDLAQAREVSHLKAILMGVASSIFQAAQPSPPP